MSSVRKKWDNLPDWGKGAVIVGGGYVLYKIGALLFSNDNSGGTTDNLTGGSNLTYPSQQYKVFADAFEAAVWGGTFGATEDDTAMGVILMSMNTLDDVIALNNAYGKRISWAFFSDGLNLTQTVTQYLDNSVKNLVNQNYLDKGINFVWP